MGRVISRDRMNGSRFNLTIIGIDLCIINQLLRFIKTVAIPLCIKLGSSWKSLSIIYDRHGRNFNQTFKWGFAKTRRISYRKRVTWPRVTRTSASSYFSILCWENRVVIAKLPDETSCRDLPFRVSSSSEKFESFEENLSFSLAFV